MLKVREAMTAGAGSCEMAASLQAAAMIMWQRDCGAVPIVDRENRVVGMITDRDICMALATRNRCAADVSVGEVASGKTIACRAEDNVEDALKLMRKHQLRRLPVIDDERILLGVLSISDCLKHAGKGKQKVARKKVFAALREISSFRPLQMRELNDQEIESDAANDGSQSNAESPEKLGETHESNETQQRFDEKFANTDSGANAKSGVNPKSMVSNAENQAHDETSIIEPNNEANEDNRKISRF